MIVEERALPWGHGGFNIMYVRTMVHVQRERHFSLKNPDPLTLLISIICIIIPVLQKKINFHLRGYAHCEYKQPIFSNPKMDCYSFSANVGHVTLILVACGLDIHCL